LTSFPQGLVENKSIQRDTSLRGRGLATIPKVWDGEQLCLYQPWVEACLDGASVIGDQHFEIGTLFNKVKFITPIEHTTSKRKSGQGVVTLTKAEDQLNHAIHTTRAPETFVTGNPPTSAYPYPHRRALTATGALEDFTS